MATSSLSPSDARILSKPCRVFWGGFESDTYRLQQAGWQVAVEYEISHMSYRLMIHNEAMRLYAITSIEQVDRHYAQYGSDGPPPTFHVVHAGTKLEVVRVPNVDFSKFQQIDATPCFVETRIESIEDTNIFNVLTTRAEEIVIDKADMSVVEHLEAIKELQQPEQKRIRDDIRRRGDTPEGCVIDRDSAPRTTVIANLVAVA